MSLKAPGGFAVTLAVTVAPTGTGIVRVSPHSDAPGATQKFKKDGLNGTTDAGMSVSRLLG